MIEIQKRKKTENPEKRHPFLTTNECQMLRGMAIVAIFMHNYCHMLKDSVHENEFFYNPDWNVQFWNRIYAPDFLIQTFSFLGHLGVPVFVFLTGYGLVSKYESASVSRIGVWQFLFHHYAKFFYPMLWGMTAFCVVFFLLNGGLWEGWWQMLLGQMTLTNNLVLHPDCFIKPGPYWYFGMTMQLYVIYRVLVFGRSARILALLVLVSLSLLCFAHSHLYTLIWLKYNSVGWFVPFVMGLLLAKCNGCICDMCKSKWLAFAFLAGGLVLLSGFNYYAWLFIPVFAIVFFIGLAKLLGSRVKVFTVLGNLSLYIFVVHPIVREVLLNTIPMEYRNGGLVVYALSTMVCAFLIGKLVMLFRR